MTEQEKQIEEATKKNQQQARLGMLSYLGWAKIKLHSTGLDRFAISDYASKIKVLIAELEKEFEE